MNSFSKPYLSIVVAVRNDNYGGDFTQRLQRFIDWNTELLEKYNIETEIILVNWNPLQNKKSIKETINWPKGRSFVEYKIITVNQELHQIFAKDITRKELPLYEYLAKNTGIRRAKGRFILAMNPDILIHSSIIHEIAKKNLDENKYYRANRVDFFGDVNQVIRLWLKGFTYPIQGKLRALRYFYLKQKNELRCYWRKQSVHHEKYFKKKEWTVYYHNIEYQYHCNVSGDFMMMSRKAWFSLNGNPENKYIPLHTDAITVVMAATFGIKEVVFNHPVYHQEHERRFDAREKENPDNREAYAHFQQEAQKMLNDKKAIIYNDDSWGLRNFDLPETII